MPGLFLFFADYVLTICMQIFIPCYFGNELTWQSAKLPVQIYKSNWFDSDISHEYRQCVVFFIMIANKPISINILHFFDLNLTAFEKVGFTGKIVFIKPGCESSYTSLSFQVLNGAYSIFAVLKKQDV